MSVGGAVAGAAEDSHLWRALRAVAPFRDTLTTFLTPFDALLLHEALPGAALLTEPERRARAHRFLWEHAVCAHASAPLYRWAVTRGVGYRAGVNATERIRHACEAAARGALPLLRCIMYCAREFAAKLWTVRNARRLLCAAATAATTDALRFAARCIPCTDADLDAVGAPAKILDAACGARDSNVSALMTVARPRVPVSLVKWSHVLRAVSADHAPNVAWLLDATVTSRRHVTPARARAFVNAALDADAERVLRCYLSREDALGFAAAVASDVRTRTESLVLGSPLAAWLLRERYARLLPFNTAHKVFHAIVGGADTVRALHGALGEVPLACAELCNDETTPPRPSALRRLTLGHPYVAHRRTRADVLRALDAYEPLATAAGAADARMWRALTGVAGATYVCGSLVV